MKFLENKRALLSTVFIAAIAVRLCTMVVLESYGVSKHQFGWGYGKTAMQVALGEGFSLLSSDSGVSRPSAISPPGYVYFIALIFSLFGVYSVKSAIVIQIVQSVTAALTCLVFYQLGKRFHESVGLLAALAIAFYPPSILFSVMRISPIILVVLLLALIMHYLFKIQERWRFRDAVICGVLMGVNVLMEPVGILFYVAGCVWLVLWSSGSRWAAVKHSLIMGAVCMICILPWTIRNYIVFDSFVLIKSSMGRNLLDGSNPYSDGMLFHTSLEKVFSEKEFEKMRTMNEAQRNRIMQKKAIEFIKADPATFIKRTFNRIYYYWNFVNPYSPSPYDKLRIIFYGPVLIFAAVGLLLGRKRWKETSLLLFLFLSYPVPYYITQITINRYRYAPEAFLLVVASYAALELVKRIRGRLPMALHNGS